MIDLFKRIGWYTGSTIYTVSVQVILTIFLIKQLNLAEYGVVGLFLAIAAILSVFISLGSENAVARSVFENEDVSNKKVVKAALLIVSLNTFILVSLVLIASLFFTFNKFYFSILVIFAASMQACLTILLAQLQMRDLASKYALINFLFNTFIFIITIISFSSISFYGRLIAPSLSGLLTIIIYLFFFKGRYLFVPSFAGDFRYISKVGFPLLPHMVFGVLNGYGDRVILSLAGNSTLLGAYSIISQILNIQLTALSTINNVYIPWLYRMLDKKKIINWAFYMLITFLLGCLITFIFWFVENIIDIDDKYFTIIEASKFLGVCFFLDSVYYILVGKLYFYKKSFLISINSVSHILIRSICAIIYVTKFPPTIFGMLALYVMGSFIRALMLYTFFRNVKNVS